jgi:integrase
VINEGASLPLSLSWSDEFARPKANGWSIALTVRFSSHRGATLKETGASFAQRVVSKDGRCATRIVTITHKIARKFSPFANASGARQKTEGVIAMGTKRGQNEGSIFRRKDGRWCGVLNLGWENGRRKRKSFYGKIASEVREQLLKARSDHSRGLPVTIDCQNVQQYLDHWLEHTLKAKAKPRSYESFSAIARLHIKPALGRIQLHKLAPQHIQKLLDGKSKGGLSPQTVTNIRTVLRSALSQAMKWNLISRNSAALVNAPRIPHKRIEPLDPEHARKLLEIARGGRFEAIYTVALTLGMRRGEVLGLRWSDIDFDGRAIRVNQSVQRLSTGSDKGKKSELRATETKTDGSRRTIALPDSVVRALRMHRARRAQDRLSAGMSWKDQNLVFTNRSGRPIEPILLHRDYKALLRKAELPSTLRFHDLRHSAASLLLAQGVHPRAIMELLGHSSITVTMNVYGHVMPAMMRDAADKMDAILGK